MEKSTVAASLGGAISAIVVWVVETWGHQSIPPGIASAFTTIIMALLTQFVPDSKPKT